MEALSLTFGQFYQILACCKSQFVFSGLAWKGISLALFLLGSAAHSGAAFLGSQRWARARKSAGMETLALSLSWGKSFMLSVTIESALPCSAHTQKALS